ncbi:hypothetical protein LIER_15449 [Lithospermum erythrorhizon]|uniref:Uncharacterized protein n=1 Tax=Lithospermum erythrorhizon TaxID=34254 RepID=A0AAV3Q4K0_LITER
MCPYIPACASTTTWAPSVFDKHRKSISPKEILNRVSRQYKKDAVGYCGGHDLLFIFILVFLRFEDGWHYPLLIHRNGHFFPWVGYGQLAKASACLFIFLGTWLIDIVYRLQQSASISMIGDQLRIYDLVFSHQLVDDQL